MLGERRTWPGWPEVRSERGVFRIEGHCCTVERWLALRRGMLCIVVVVGLYLLATSLLGLYWPWIVYSPARDFGLSMSWVRTASVKLFTEQFPELGRAVWFVPGLVDWHMMGVALLLLLFRRHISGLMARMLDPLIQTGFRFRITRDTISARAGLRRCRIDRRTAPATIRITSADEYFVGRASEIIKRWPGVNKLQPPAVLEIVQHFGRRRLLLCRRTDQAEAIAAACRRALNESSTSKVKF